MILFRNRQEAGEKLAEKLKEYKARKDAIILGIPRGGVAVGAALAEELSLSLDLIIPRKLPIPVSPEMGFGAILGDGTRLLNRAAIEAYGLGPEIVEKVSRIVLKEVKRREKEYRGKTGLADVRNKIVIMVDDGLATGFTMLAAIKAIKKANPKKIIIAVPVSPETSIKRIKPKVDEIVCLYVQPGYESFAVAGFYQDFRDLTDKEVKNFLKNLNKGSDLLNKKSPIS